MTIYSYVVIAIVANCILTPCCFLSTLLIRKSRRTVIICLAFLLPLRIVFLTPFIFNFFMYATFKIVLWPHVVYFVGLALFFPLFCITQLYYFILILILSFKSLEMKCKAMLAKCDIKLSLMEQGELIEQQSPRSDSQLSISTSTLSLSSARSTSSTIFDELSFNHGSQQITEGNTPSSNTQATLILQNPVLMKIVAQAQHLEDKCPCAICFDEERCILFKPCNHAKTCKSCAEKLTTCPFCKAEIISMQKIFI